MTIVDPIGDMFTRIRNGQMRFLNTIDLPASNFRLKILEVLKQEGYITNYVLEKKEKNKRESKKISRAVIILSGIILILWLP